MEEYLFILGAVLDFQRAVVDLLFAVFDSLNRNAVAFLSIAPGVWVFVARMRMQGGRYHAYRAWDWLYLHARWAWKRGRGWTKPDWFVPRSACLLLVLVFVGLPLDRLEYLLVSLAGARIAWMLYFQWRVIFKDTGPVKSYRRSAVLALCNYAEMVFFFAFVNRVFADQFERDVVDVRSIEGALMASLAASSSFGQTLPGPVAPTGLGVVILFVQSAVGLFMTLVVLAQVISVLPPRGQELRQ